MEVECNSDEVTFSMDEVIVRIGEFGRFQKILDAIFCLITFPVSIQYILMYFSSLFPPWRCANNSSVCLLNGTQPPDDNSRCKMSRADWYYTKPSEYSLVTQFDLHCDKEWLLHLTSSIFIAGWAVGSVILGWIGDNYGRKLFFSHRLPSF